MQSHLDGNPGTAAGLTLERLPRATSACIVRVEGDDVLARRLADHGLWPGVTLWLLARAPFGDPLLVWVQGCRLAIRRDEARRVHVRLTPEPR